MSVLAYLKRTIVQVLIFLKIRKHHAKFSPYYITYRYILAGCQFAEKVSEIIVQDKLCINAALLEWETSEEEYIEAGFRTLSIDAFMDHAMWGVPLKGVDTKRPKGEEPMRHARFYRYYVLKNRMEQLQNLFESEGLLDFEPSRRIPKFQA